MASCRIALGAIDERAAFEVLVRRHCLRDGRMCRVQSFTRPPEPLHLAVRRFTALQDIVRSRTWSAQMYTTQHAAEQHDEQPQQQEERRYGPHGDLTFEEFRNLLDSTPQTAFISGYADLTEDEFNTNYLEQLDESITHGDTFVMAASGGFAESKAPEYLSANGVAEDRIHIYDVNPATGELDMIQHSCGDRPIADIIGTVAERDAVLTNKSGYDILWLRTVDEESRWESNVADSLDPKFDIPV